jgi:hypothetical protein
VYKDPAVGIWFRNMDLAAEDPTKIRHETIDWILRQLKFLIGGDSTVMIQ